MSAQIPLHFTASNSFDAHDFIITPSNQKAYDLVLDPSLWRGFCLLVSGERGCGKTHLLHVAANHLNAQMLSHQSIKDIIEGDIAQGDVFIIDDADAMIGDKAAEETLFHLYNKCMLAGANMIVALNDVPATEHFCFKDLHSRLMGASMVRIDAPDDMLMQGILMKLFSDRQLMVDPAVINYIATRAERSIATLKDIVEKIDAQAIAEKRKITVPFVKGLLD